MVSAQSKKQKSDTSQIRAALERAFEDGRQQGLCQRQAFLNCLKTTNHNLWTELCRLDQDEPDEGILIPVVFAEKLEKAVKKDHSGYARQLRKLIRKHSERLDKILSILESCKRYK